MERRHIQCDRDQCTGCMICEFACSAAKEGRFDLELSRIRVLRATPTLLDVVACRLCRNTPCVKECPRGALALSETSPATSPGETSPAPSAGETSPAPSASVATGTITLDRARCAGCGWCLEACPFGAIGMDESTKTIVVCDLCRAEGQPACIQACPRKALSLRVVSSGRD